MENAVARRVLNCTIEGNRQEITVSLGRPQEDDRCFRCEYEIAFQGRTQLHAICGVDAIHALQLAILMIGSTLSSLPGASDWTWNGEPKTGFPTSLDEPITGLRS
jgi:hypothetical protein